MQIDWNILGQSLNRPDAGQMFQHGMEQGQKRRQEQETRNALASFAQNPDDPRAVNALMAVDPRMGLQVRQHQSDTQRQKREEDERTIKVFGRAAKLAKDPQSWDAIIDQLAPQYPDALAYKGKFDPNLRAALMAQAGEEDDQAQTPSFIREADALGIPRDRARQLWETKQGTVMIDGIPHVMRPSSADGQSPPPVTNEAEYNALPPGAEYLDPTGQVRRKGGAPQTTGAPTFPQ